LRQRHARNFGRFDGDAAARAARRSARRDRSVVNRRSTAIPLTKPESSPGSDEEQEHGNDANDGFVHAGWIQACRESQPIIMRSLQQRRKSARTMLLLPFQLFSAI
jgi:hypothetical protein